MTVINQTAAVRSRVPSKVETREIAGFQLVNQERLRWCWAAVALSVVKTLNPASRYTRQCDVACDTLRRTLSVTGQVALDVRHCCTARAACNTEAGLQDAMETVGYRPGVTGPVTFDLLWANLPGRLLCARHQHETLGGHFVSITGAKKVKTGTRESRLVQVGDPLITAVYFCPFGEFVSGYLGSGVWTDTYWT